MRTYRNPEDDIEYFDIIAEGTNGDYNSETVELIREYARSRFTELNAQMLLGFTNTSLQFILGFSLNSILLKVHQELRMHAERTKTSISDNDKVLLEFVVYLNNLMTTKKFKIESPRVGSPTPDAANQINQNELSRGPYTKQVLIPGVMQDDKYHQSMRPLIESYAK